MYDSNDAATFCMSPAAEEGDVHTDILLAASRTCCSLRCCTTDRKRNRQFDTLESLRQSAYAAVVFLFPLLLLASQANNSTRIAKARSKQSYKKKNHTSDHPTPPNAHIADLLPSLQQAIYCPDVLDSTSTIFRISSPRAFQTAGGISKLIGELCFAAGELRLYRLEVGGVTWECLDYCGLWVSCDHLDLMLWPPILWPAPLRKVCYLTLQDDKAKGPRHHRPKDQKASPLRLGSQAIDVSGSFPTTRR